MIIAGLLCLQLAVYHEARSESLIGQLLVAEVVINRVNSRRFPNTTCEVVKQKWQFSFYPTEKEIKDKKAWKLAGEISKIMMKNNIHYGEDICNYFRNDVQPKWAENLEYIYSENVHKFYAGGCK